MATRRGSPEPSEDALLTVDELEAKGRELLLLQCGPLHLDTSGTPRELAQRLFDAYHPVVTETALTPIPEEKEAPLSPQASPTKSVSSSTTSSLDDEEDSPHKRRRKRRHVITSDDGRKTPM